MIDADPVRVAVLIVSFRNPQDVRACLAALSRSTEAPGFDVFVCENGGYASFQELCEILTDPEAPCNADSDDLTDPLVAASGRLVEVKRLTLKTRRSRVWIGCAEQNLGYAGGINVWIDRLLPRPEWTGLWVLNPDSEPEPRALQTLVERAAVANKGMVGSTIVSSANRDFVHCRAGHHWRKLRSSFSLIGLGEPVNAPIDLEAIERALDCIAGGSMYVTRACLEKIGPMDERFFLFYEDADWSIRAKKFGLGYAPASIIPHSGGTTIGSSRLRAERSRLSVYLESRNNLHFVGMYWRRYLPFALLFGCVHAASYLFVLSPNNFRAALEGLIAGLKGETGRPTFHE
ncbi:glycosyltransferase family 2 protein [Bradyrhizobium canariense]|uniref:glycosyltransferase family 2 protein n=1 Tax=Bradyrhizobium canariense TaxID=255045 RepID=UPI0028973EE3|nr:glycosyltransferase family 2 protein [Bradyrhizobium canariense]